uniref:Glycolipid transfer protein domain-containing protein n=1 Tax=Aegilops tauschii subsp. strangulata TaxID=200361 RepID=A0A453P403_AEGTS
MAETVFAPCLEGMKHVRSDSGVMLAKPFLDVCKQILPVLDKFGAAMAIVKSDIGGNITRLENKYSSDPTKYEHLYTMVQEEVEKKTAKGSSSCTNGLLWLTRFFNFSCVICLFYCSLIEIPIGVLVFTHIFCFQGNGLPC